MIVDDKGSGVGLPAVGVPPETDEPRNVKLLKKLVGQREETNCLVPPAPAPVTDGEIR